MHEYSNPVICLFDSLILDETQFEKTSQLDSY